MKPFLLCLSQEKGFCAVSVMYTLIITFSLEVFVSSFDRVFVTPFDYLNSISGERVRDNQHPTDNVVN